METSRQVTRSSSSNLALAFILLSRRKREGMSALYAFCREVDDVADDEALPTAERRRRLHEWRDDIRRAFRPDQTPVLPINRDIRAILPEFPGLKCCLFEELLSGVEMDLDQQRYDTWEELDRYCYRVASVVGLLSIEIFGYQDHATREYAVKLGRALQLTNILRDIRVDAEKNRIYLPREEREKHQVAEADILKGRFSIHVRNLAAAVAQQAIDHFNSARSLLPACDRRSMIAAELMGAVYWELLLKVERRGFNVFNGKLTRVGKPRKLILILRTWLRINLGINRPNYGI